MKEKLVRVWGKYSNIQLRDDIEGFCPSNFPRLITCIYSVIAQKESISSLEIDLRNAYHYYERHSAFGIPRPSIYGFYIDWCTCVNAWPKDCYSKFFYNGYLFVRENIAIADSLNFKISDYEYISLDVRTEEGQ